MIRKRALTNAVTSTVEATAVSVSSKCDDFTSWGIQENTTVETEVETKITRVDKNDALDLVKEVVPPALEDSAEYLRSLIEDIGWRRVLMVEFQKDYMDEIVKFLKAKKAKGVKIFPPEHQIFNAFNLTPLDRIRVVLIGQDPYHNDNQAHGLCFSVCKDVKLPRTLVNIYKELKIDFPNFETPDHGCLESWARQGVFMLNATLTVEAHRANSHSRIGWRKFTDEVIRIISRDCKGVVFLLWGRFAQSKEHLIDKEKHAVIMTAHPSPQSAHLFLNCKCFYQTNEALEKFGRPAIDWCAL